MYTQITGGVHRLTQGIANFYLIHDAGKLVLVDAGAPKDWAQFTQLVAALGSKLDDLEAVLLTHAHGDHIGFSERARSTTGARVWVHQSDKQEATTGKPPAGNDGKLRSYLLKGQMYRTIWILARAGASKIIPVAEVSAFGDGETIDVPGRPRVLHAPGHTAGSAALLFESHRVLCTGDVLVTLNPLTGGLGPQIMPAGFNRDTTQAMSSLGNIAGATADFVLAGHGEPWTGGVPEAIRLARAAGRS